MNRMGQKFLYFAYGSNLLRQRIQLRNPSAVFQTIGKLEGYKLTFNWNSPPWHGAVADVVEAPGHHVWGVVWELDVEHIETLDRQEDVHNGIYKPIEITVTSPADKSMTCRCYQQTLEPTSSKLPSQYYRKVIIDGAQQNKLPAQYIEGLKKIPVNDYQGTCELYDSVMKLLDQ